jgi:hypothetical protein
MSAADLRERAIARQNIAKRRRRRKLAATMSISQWAAMADLAEDGRSIATARALIANGEGPSVAQVRRRHRSDDGVRLRDHRRWIRANPWAKYLVAEAAAKRRREQRRK